MSKTSLYELTPEHRARLPGYRALGDAIVLRTAPQTEEERGRCRGAIERSVVEFERRLRAAYIAHGHVAGLASIPSLHVSGLPIDEAPIAVHRDEQSRPHRADGPFIAWPDGVGCYAWHGVRVPAWLIEHPERITVAIIDGEANAEVRRVMIERYGWQRYLKDAGAIMLSEAIDEGGEPMRLLRRAVKDDEPIVALHLRNSTPDPDGTRREYIVRVPPEMRDVWAARNWSFELPADARFGAVS